jgi:hypothetical protein
VQHLGLASKHSFGTSAVTAAKQTRGRALCSLPFRAVKPRRAAEAPAKKPSSNGSSAVSSTTSPEDEERVAGCALHLLRRLQLATAQVHLCSKSDST